MLAKDTIQEPQRSAEKHHEHESEQELEPESGLEQPEVDKASIESSGDNTRGRLKKMTPESESHGYNEDDNNDNNNDNNQSRTDLSKGSNSNSNSNETLDIDENSVVFERTSPSRTRSPDEKEHCHSNNIGTDSQRSRTCSKDSSSETLKPPGPQEPLPTSPSQRSIEKAVAQKFASLGIPQRPTWRARMDRFILHEGPRVLFLVYWCLIQVAIFYFSFVIYNRSMNYSHIRATLGTSLGIARGSAAVINFNCGLILFSVCRNLISLLRSTFLNDIVPFDKNIMFHKTVAWSIVFFTVVHIVGHYVNYYHLEMEQVQQWEKQQQRQQQSNEVEVKRMSAEYMAFVTGPGFTGHLLVLLLFLIVTSSVERVRRKSFETFWYTHHLFILFFIVLMYHGAFCFIHADKPPYCKSSPGTYKFIVFSLVMYIVERIFREFRARRPTSISKIVLHPSKVVEVQIKKEGYSRYGSGTGDPYFRAKAGQYMFLNCPDISAFEWHPFTITSAPEEDYVSVHIRIVGDWTTAFARRLGCSFDDEQQFWTEELMSRSRDGAAGGNSGLGFSSGVSLDAVSQEAKFRSSTLISGSNILQRNSEPMTLPRVLIDGPYGSPSEDAFNYEIAVLVGAGIGVTPFASVLKHIWYSVMQPTKIITLRKVYFFWVCRDRDAFEWFQDLLIALEEQNMSDFLEIRSYLTGELGAEEMHTVLMEARTAAAMTAARHLQQQNRKRQLLSRGDGDYDGDDDEAEYDNDNVNDKDNAGVLKDTYRKSNTLTDTLSEGRDRDAITGLRSPTYYGRPNFDKIFGELAQAHPREHGQVGVFFCGPKPLGKTLHRCARKYKFKFHKENF